LVPGDFCTAGICLAEITGIGAAESHIRDPALTSPKLNEVGEMVSALTPDPLKGTV
jgi:hypothetical protein